MSRFFVEPWSTDYGASMDIDVDGDGAGSKADVTVERPASKWEPISPSCQPAKSVVFVDGVQQIDARVWLTDDDNVSRMGICVSYAAGTVRCSEAATLESSKVARGAFGPLGLGDIDCGANIYYRGVPVVDTTPAGLAVALRRLREDLEVDLAHQAGQADLVVVDGHVRQRETIPGAVGYLKSHQVQYLDTKEAAVVGRLAPGQRTPVFLLETPWSRYSWYLKLPGVQGHPWSGVVRCEASPSLSAVEAVTFADFVSASLPRFASREYKDPRAPQNLYPIAGLERELRRRLGERELLLRALQKLSHVS